MGKLLNITTSLHESSNRDYLPRMVDDKANCMIIAKQYEKDYWDGDRKYGYGGERRRWVGRSYFIIRYNKYSN